MEQKSRLASKFEFDLTAACLSFHMNKVSDSDDARSPTVEIVVWLPSGHRNFSTTPGIEAAFTSSNLLTYHLSPSELRTLFQDLNNHFDQKNVGHYIIVMMSFRNDHVNTPAG